MAPVDPHRPDLDAIVDDVASSMTSLDERHAEASRLRTMAALRGTEIRSARRWPVLAALTAAALLFLVARTWTPRTGAPHGPAPTPITARSLASIVEAADPVASRRPGPEVERRPAGDRRTAATSATPAPARDPLVALVRAVNAIPDDAWSRGEAAASTTALNVPAFEIQPIAVTPLDVTPPVPLGDSR